MSVTRAPPGDRASVWIVSRPANSRPDKTTSTPSRCVGRAGAVRRLVRPEISRHCSHTSLVRHEPDLQHQPHHPGGRRQVRVQAGHEVEHRGWRVSDLPGRGLLGHHLRHQALRHHPHSGGEGQGGDGS